MLSKLLTSFFLIIVAPTVALSQAAPAINLDQQSFKIIVKESQHCLDVSGLENARVIKSKCNNGNGQGWFFAGIGLGHYQIKSHNNSMCLEVAGSSLSDEASLQQFPCGDGTKRNQHWTLKQTTDGKHELISVNSGKCLNVLNDDHINGGQAVQYTCNQAGNQAMILEVINTPAHVNRTPTAVASAEPVGSGGSYTQSSSPVYVPGSLLPVTGTDSSWGSPNAVIKAEVMFETPEYTKQISSITINNEKLTSEDNRRDVFSGMLIPPIVHFRGHTYFVWVDTDRRPRITKIDGTGTSTTMPIDHGLDYIQATNGHGRFSVGIDLDGYIHIVGDMHNFTVGTKDYFLDRDRYDTVQYPARYHNKNIMYWKSKAPEDITSFEIMGRANSEWLGKASSSTIPASGYQHGRFFTDLFGTLYVSGRTKGILQLGKAGEYGLGIARYDTSTKTWSALGAEPPRIDPSKEYAKVVLWDQSGSNGGSFVGYLANPQFDSQNRLLVASTAHTNGGEDPDSVVFAMSKDFGASWTKANGTPIANQPIRAADGPWQGDIVSRSTQGLHTRVFSDQYGVIGVASPNRNSWWLWNGGSWNADSELIQLGARYAHMASNKSLVMTGGNSTIMHTTGFGKTTYKYNVGDYQEIGAIDEAALRTTGVAYCLAFTRGHMKQVVLRITAK